jgi:hypothetical protein
MGPMPIDFFNMLDDTDWKPLVVNASDPQSLWKGGGKLVDAPVDVEATFDGAIWTGSPLMLQFFMRAIRLRPNFTFPRYERNVRELIVVFGGECEIRYQDAAGHEQTQRVVGPGGFFVSEAGSPHTIVAGPEGVTYTEQWDHLAPRHELLTTWHDEGWVRR